MNYSIENMHLFDRYKTYILLKKLGITSYDIRNAISDHQERPWNGNTSSEDAPEEIIFRKIYQYINSGIEVQNFFYKGDIFRIHPPTTTLASRINSKIEFQSGPICIDGSCSVLPITRYEGTMRGFGKSYDFTRRDFYKINQGEKAVFLHCNTGNMYGIDINSLAKSIGCFNPQFEYEKEVLFPIQKEYIIKEYICTPIEFKIKMENYFANGEIVPRRS